MTHFINGARVVTRRCWDSPMPAFRWKALPDGYDGADGGDPVGYGATEAEAVANLEEMVEAREEAS